MKDDVWFVPSHNCFPYQSATVYNLVTLDLIMRDGHRSVAGGGISTGEIVAADNRLKISFSAFNLEATFYFV